MKEFVVNLDTQPFNRWTDIVKDKGPQVRNSISYTSIIIGITHFDVIGIVMLYISTSNVFSLLDFKLAADI